MSDRSEADRASDDLVERVAHVFWDTPGKPDDRLRAAIAVALEEAAMVCERRFMGDHNREDMEARRCAAAIRAMIPKEEV